MRKSDVNVNVQLNVTVKILWYKFCDKQKLVKSLNLPQFSINGYKETCMIWLTIEVLVTDYFSEYQCKPTTIKILQMI